MLAAVCTGFLTACGASSTDSTASLSAGAGTPSLTAVPNAAGERQQAALASSGSGSASPVEAHVKPAQGGMLVPVSKAGAGNSDKTAAAASGADATQALDKITAAGKPGSNAYKIGPQDLLEISVFKVAELSKQVQVAENGTINLPLLGEVRAAGSTARELEQQLTTSLGSKYLQNPQVTVYVREYNSQRVTLEGGGIKKPGVYALKGKMTLLQLIATADGLSDISDSEFSVFRQSGEKRNAVRYNVSTIRSGEVEDPDLAAGDVIVATTSTTKEVFNTVLKAVPIAAAARPF